MLLAFCDETERENFFGFATLIANEHATKALTASLTKVMENACWAYDIEPWMPEFHGQPLFQGRGAFQKLEPRVRVGLYQKVIDAIVAEDVLIVLRSVYKDRLTAYQDRMGYANRQPPEEVCLRFLMQRINMIAKSADTHALLIADERGDRERHRERFALYQTMGTPGVYMSSTLDRLLDTIHFAPSHHSRMLQAADMVAFLWGRHETVTETNKGNYDAVERLWNTLRGSGKLREVGTWP